MNDRQLDIGCGYQLSCKIFFTLTVSNWPACGSLPVFSHCRKAAIQSAMKAVKGKVESFYFAFGSDDVVVIVDAPDNIPVAALALATASSGHVRVRTTPLLTVDEIDQALAHRRCPEHFQMPCHGLRGGG